MASVLRYKLKGDEYDAFKVLFSTFNIKKQDVEGLHVEEIRKIFRKKYNELSLAYHPDKNPDNEKAKEIFQCLSKKKVYFEEFIIEPLQKGLKSNLMREVHKKLSNTKLENLERYLNEEGRTKLEEKGSSMMTGPLTYGKHSLGITFIGGVILLISSIAFIVQNGIFYSAPIILGYLAVKLIENVTNALIKHIYSRNNEIHLGSITTLLLMCDFDSQCKNFPEHDKTKLKWLRNSIILNSVLFPSLTFCYAGLDLIANGFGITNTALLSGSLLILPFILILVTLPVTNAIFENILKNTATDLILEQFKHNNDKSPSSDLNGVNFDGVDLKTQEI